MPITGRPSNWSCGMPWFFIHDRCTSPSRSRRPNHATERSVRRDLADLAMTPFGFSHCVACAWWWMGRAPSYREPLARRLVEDVHHRRIDAKCDLVSRIHDGAAMRDEHDLSFSDLDQQLGFRTGGLDDDDLAGDRSRRIRRGEVEMLGPDAIRDPLTFGARRCPEWPAHAAGRFDVGRMSVPAHRALDHIHRRRADELS